MTGKTKWIVGLLALSVAINLFVLGIWLGREFRGNRPPRGAAPREYVEFNMRRLATYLPEAGQEKVRSIMKAHHVKLRDHFREMRQQESEVKTLLVAETVDVDALAAALDAQQTKMRELRMPIREIILEVVAKLDLETRQALANDLFSRKGRPGGPRGDDDRRRPPFGEGRMPPPDDGFGPPPEEGEGPPPPPEGKDQP